MFIVSTNLNPYNEGLTAAIKERNAEKIQKIALAAQDAGADYLEVTGAEGDVAESLKWVIEKVQEVSDLPLIVGMSGLTEEKDIKDVVALVKKPGIINGICTQKMADIVLPLFDSLDMDWKLVINTVHDQGQQAGQSLLFYQDFVRQAGEHGLTPDRIIFDPCVNSLKKNPDAYNMFEEYFDAFSNDWRDSEFIVEAYKITEGVDKPEMLKIAFLVLALGYGVEYIKADVFDSDIKDVFYACNALFDNESGLKEYEEYVNQKDPQD